MQNKKRDDEKGIWLLVGGIFTVFLMIVDFFYSSFDEMAFIAIIGLWIAHIAISGGWIISMAKFKDPNYDFVRKIVVVLSVVTSFIVGMHHAISVEDKQVIEDSNQAKKTSYLLPLDYNDNRYAMMVSAKYNIGFVGFTGASYDALFSRSHMDSKTSELIDFDKNGDSIVDFEQYISICDNGKVGIDSFFLERLKKHHYQ